MDGINIGVKVDASGAAETLGKVADGVDKVSTATEKQTDLSNKSLAGYVASERQKQQFIKSLTDEVNTYGKSRDAILAYKAAQLGVTDQAQGMIDQLKQMQSAPINDAGAAMEHFGFQTAGAKRELLVLMHELSQGNYSRFAGSIMVLGERTNAMGAIFAAATSPITLVAVSMLAVAAAAIKGAMEVKELQDSMQLTGDYAGLTVAKFGEMSKSIANVGDVGVTSARGVLSGLVATGKFTSDTLEGTALAILNVSRLSGQSSSEVIKDFEKMSDGVALWAEQHNKSMHFLTLAQYEHIQALEDEGKKTEAMHATTDALNSKLKENKDNLGYLTSGWRTVEEAASRAWAAALNLGANDESSKIAKEMEKAQNSLNAAANAKAHNVHWMGDSEDSLNARLASLKVQMDAANAAKKAASDEAKTQSDAISAEKKMKDEWTSLGGSISLVNQKINEYRDNYEKILKANPNSEFGNGLKQNAAKAEAEIRRKYDKSDFRSQNKLDGAYTSTFDSLGSDDAKLKDEISQYQQFGKVVGQSKSAILEFQIAQGKLQGLDSARIAKLRDLAAEVDADSETAAGLKGLAAIDAKLAALDKESRAQVGLKDARRESILMAELEQDRSKITAQQYEDEAKKIKSSVLAIESRNAATAIAHMQISTDSEIEKIQQESTSLGLNTLERQKLAATLRIEAQARKDILASPDQADQINAAAADQIRKIGTAYDEADEKQRSFTTGMAQSFKDYAYTASNSAADAKKVFGDTFSGMENALMTFCQTGKLSFTNLANSIISDILRIQIRQSIVAPLMGGISSALDFGGTPSSAIAPSDINMSGFGTPDYVVSGARAGGGSVFSGSSYLVGEKGPEIFNPSTSGSIVPNGVSSSGGINVQIINNSQAQVSTQSDGQGGLQVIVDMVAGSIADGVASGTGNVYHAIGSRFSKMQTT